jgi:hypothetical protein
MPKFATNAPYTESQHHAMSFGEKFPQKMMISIRVSIPDLSHGGEPARCAGVVSQKRSFLRRITVSLVDSRYGLALLAQNPSHNHRLKACAFGWHLRR